MPLPTLSDVHISTPLTNLSIAYIQKPTRFKANRLSPLVNVNKQTNSYFIFDKADFNRDGMKKRSPGTGYARLGYRVSSSSYSCDAFGLEHVMPDEVAKNYDSPMSADQAGVAFLMQQALIRRERLFVEKFLVASTWTRDVAGHASTVSDTSHVFWDNASADIIGTLKKQSRYMLSQTGYRPNRFVTTQQVVDVMMDDPDIIDRHKYTNDGPISLKAVAALCGIGDEGSPGEIVVLDAAYNSAAEGATASMGFMADDVGLLEYVAPSPQIDAPSATYTFSWSEFDNVRDGAVAVESYYEKNIKSTVYRADMFVDMKVTSTDCGIYFTNLLT